jgi:hypothetical protein
LRACGSFFPLEEKMPTGIGSKRNDFLEVRLTAVDAKYLLRNALPWSYCSRKKRKKKNVQQKENRKAKTV